MATSISGVIRAQQSFRRASLRAQERRLSSEALQQPGSFKSVDTPDPKGDRRASLDSGAGTAWHEESSLPSAPAEIDTNTKDPSKRTVDDEELLQACQDGNYDNVCRILSRPGIHLNMVDDDGLTPLMKAVRWGHIKIVHTLLQSGADMNHVDKMWRTAWYFACFSSVAPVGRHWRCMLELCSQTPVENLTSEHVLTACFSNQSRVLNVLLEHFERKILSRDSSNWCKFEFHDLHKLDDDEVQVTWPDGSKSKLGSTALTALIDKVKKRALVHPTIRGLILWKWNKFARYQFYLELALHTLSVACLSGNAAMLRFQDLESRGLRERVGDILAQNVTLAISTMFLLQDMLNLYNRRRRGHQESILRYTGAVLQAGLNLAVVVLFLIDASQVSSRIEQGMPVDMSGGLPLVRVYMFRVYAMTVVWLWLRFFTYLELVSWIGAFFIMVERIMREDLTRWATVVIVSMPGFSLAFNLIFDVVLSNFEADPTTDPVALAEVHRLRSSYGGWDRAIYGQVLIMFSLDSWPRGQHEPVSALLLIGFVLMLNLISVNLLIAMMTSTYEAVKEDALPEWNFRQARYIVERSHWFSRDFVRYKPEYGSYKFSGYYHLVFPNLKEDHAEQGSDVLDALEEKEPLDMDSFLASQAEMSSRIDSFMASQANMSHRISALQSMVEMVAEELSVGSIRATNQVMMPRRNSRSGGVVAAPRHLDAPGRSRFYDAAAAETALEAPGRDLGGESGAVLDDINRILGDTTVGTSVAGQGSREGAKGAGGARDHPLGVPVSDNDDSDKI